MTSGARGRGSGSSSSFRRQGDPSTLFCTRQVSKDPYRVPRNQLKCHLLKLTVARTKDTARTGLGAGGRKTVCPLPETGHRHPGRQSSGGSSAVTCHPSPRSSRLPLPQEATLCTDTPSPPSSSRSRAEPQRRPGGKSQVGVSVPLFLPVRRHRAGGVPPIAEGRYSSWGVCPTRPSHGPGPAASPTSGPLGRAPGSTPGSSVTDLFARNPPSMTLI